MQFSSKAWLFAIASATAIAAAFISPRAQIINPPSGSGNPATMLHILPSAGTQDFYLGGGLINGEPIAGMIENPSVFSFPGFKDWFHIMFSRMEGRWTYGAPITGAALGVCGHTFEIDSKSVLCVNQNGVNVWSVDSVNAFYVSRAGDLTTPAFNVDTHTNASSVTGLNIISFADAGTSEVDLLSTGPGSNVNIRHLPKGTGIDIFNRPITVNGVSANIANGGGISIGGDAKAVATGKANLLLLSDDAAANRLNGTVALFGDPTAGNRRMIVQVTESGVSFRPLSLQESGGNVTIGRANGAVLSPGDLLSVAGQSTFNNKFYLSGLGAASGTPNSICQDNTTKETTVNATTSCLVSSRDYKQDIMPLDGSPAAARRTPIALDGSATARIKALRPSQFAYKDAPDRERWGFIAEEVADADPHMADAWDDNGVPRSLDLPAILSQTVQALQEALARIEVLEAQARAKP